MNAKIHLIFAFVTTSLAVLAATPLIVIPDAPTAVEKFAASELAGELGKCLGSTPAIKSESQLATISPQHLNILYVGATKVAKDTRRKKNWEQDGVFIKSVKDGVVLNGDPKRAPIYAVDLYLEKYCGVRWWTSDTAHYPKLKEVPLENINLEYVPQFKYRETYYLDGFDPLFKVRSKGNFTSLTRYLLSDVKYVPPEMGGNHRLYFFKGRRSAYHSFFEILPPKEYFDKHPEWYSLVKGNRTPKQLCLANTEMKAEYIKETLKRLREDSNVDFIQVSQNDWRYPCECESCKALSDNDGGSPSGLYLSFANDVAEAVEKEFPDVRIDTFAYQFTRKAPTRTRPRHNVVVRLCDIECDFANPLADATSSVNASFVKDIAEWKRVADGNLFIWDYVVNFSNYMLPHPNLYSLGPNVKLFARSGAVGIFEQGDALCVAGEFNRLRHWVLTHLLWDPTQDDIALIDEFVRGYYGNAAAPHIGDYFRVVNRPARDFKSFVTCYHRGVDSFMLPAEVDAAWKYMVKAVKSAEQEGVHFAERVRREKLSIDHAVILEWNRLRKLYEQQKREWPFEETQSEAVRRWRNDCLSFGVKARGETTDKNEFDLYCKELMEEKK